MFLIGMAIIRTYYNERVGALKWCCPFFDGTKEQARDFTSENQNWPLDNHYTYLFNLWKSFTIKYTEGYYAISSSHAHHMYCIFRTETKAPTALSLRHTIDNGHHCSAEHTKDSLLPPSSKQIQIGCDKNWATLGLQLD